VDSFVQVFAGTQLMRYVLGEKPQQRMALFMAVRAWRERGVSPILSLQPMQQLN